MTDWVELGLFVMFSLPHTPLCNLPLPSLSLFLSLILPDLTSEGQQAVGWASRGLVHHTRFDLLLREVLTSAPFLAAVPDVDGFEGVLVAAGPASHRAQMVEALRRRLKHVALD